MHVLLECPALACVRARFGDILDGREANMRDLMSENPKRLSWLVHDCSRLVEREMCHDWEENYFSIGETASSLVG